MTMRTQAVQQQRMTREQTIALLHAAVTAREQAQRLVDDRARAARREGVTFASLATILGMSQSRAHQLYGDGPTS